MVVWLLQIAWVYACCRDILFEGIFAIRPIVRRSDTVCCAALPFYYSVSLHPLLLFMFDFQAAQRTVAVAWIREARLRGDGD